MKSQYQGYSVLTETGNTLGYFFLLLWATISMAYHKTVVTPHPMHWSYHSHALSHQLDRFFPRAQHNHSFVVHYSGIIISTMASQMTGMSTVCSIVCTCTHQRKHQSSASLAFCEGKPPVTGGFPSQRASYMETVSIWQRHHDIRHVRSCYIASRQPKSYTFSQQIAQFWTAVKSIILLDRYIERKQTLLKHISRIQLQQNKI